jgi:hypothetical protein
MLYNKFLRIIQAHLLGFSTGIKFLETLLLVLHVSHVSFLRWLLGSTSLYQISQQSHEFVVGNQASISYWQG